MGRTYRVLGLLTESPQLETVIRDGGSLASLSVTEDKWESREFKPLGPFTRHLETVSYRIEPLVKPGDKPSMTKEELEELKQERINEPYRRYVFANRCEDRPYKNSNPCEDLETDQKYPFPSICEHMFSIK